VVTGPDHPVTTATPVQVIPGGAPGKKPRAADGPKRHVFLL
jgi:hypothetical protein